MSKSNRKPPPPRPRPADRPTTAQQRLAAQRAGAARARIEQAQRRRRMLAVGGSVLAVLVVVAVLVIVKVTTGAGGPKSGTKATTAQSAVVRDATSVPAAVLDAIGTGAATAGPKAISAPALTAGGKPRILYVGAEYCPYCATERWAIVVALSRFGSFSGLGQTASSPNDVYPSTNTLSFHGASYSSKYLSFTGKEIQSNQVVNGSYAPLDKLSAADQTLFSKYDAPPYVASGSQGSIPFVDIGGKYIISGASYDPAVLQGKSHAQIAKALSDRTSPIAKAADGAANLITAAVCATTSQQPAAVCTSAGVKAAAAKLGSAG